VRELQREEGEEGRLRLKTVLPMGTWYQVRPQARQGSSLLTCPVCGSGLEKNRTEWWTCWCGRLSFAERHSEDSIWIFVIDANVESRWIVVGADGNWLMSPAPNGLSREDDVRSMVEETVTASVIDS